MCWSSLNGIADTVGGRYFSMFFYGYKAEIYKYKNMKRKVLHIKLTLFFFSFASTVNGRPAGNIDDVL